MKEFNNAVVTVATGYFGIKNIHVAETLIQGKRVWLLNHIYFYQVTNDMSS